MGVAVIALPVLQGWQWVALISPLFVTLLLTKVSGVPLLEKKADAKWGGQEDYEAYKKRTPVLVPAVGLTLRDVPGVITLADCLNHNAAWQLSGGVFDHWDIRHPRSGCWQNSTLGFSVPCSSNTISSFIVP